MLSIAWFGESSTVTHYLDAANLVLAVIFCCEVTIKYVGRQSANL